MHSVFRHKILNVWMNETSNRKCLEKLTCTPLSSLIQSIMIVSDCFCFLSVEMRLSEAVYLIILI